MDTFFLAPLAEVFSRTAIQHILFYRGYRPTSIFIIDLIVQSMLDQFIGVGELWQQINLDPFAEGFQVIWFQRLQIFAEDNNMSLESKVSNSTFTLATCEFQKKA